MYVKEVREVIRDNYGHDVIFFGEDGGPYCYDNSIAGITDEGRLIYDIDSILTELMVDNNWTEEEAVDWLDYNVMRSIPYAGPEGPMVMNNTCQMYEDVKWIQEHRKAEENNKEN